MKRIGGVLKSNRHFPQTEQARSTFLSQIYALVIGGVI